MKKKISVLWALIICFSLCACGEDDNNTQDTNEPESSSTSLTDDVIPNELQGVWVDIGTPDSESEGLLTFYAFQNNNIETSVVNNGVGASYSVFSGTYTVEESKISYDFGDTSGYSLYSYDDGLVLSNANSSEMKKLSAADLIAYLETEEGASNPAGVTCLADLIIKFYPDSTESTVAIEKKAAADAAIRAEGEAALATLNSSYDKVEQKTWYESKSRPVYVDTCCYIYPGFDYADNGEISLVVELNYTDAQTGVGWVFFDTAIFSVDGENTTKLFNYYDVLRDTGGGAVVERIVFDADYTVIELLRNIANSAETIIRFQGDEYHYDHVVTSTEKTAILDVLTAYNYLMYYSE